jgi:uncharacterized protein (TIGR01777 family)
MLLHMKIVIAGGTGFLGRPLADALAAEGQDVVVLSRTPSHSRAAARFVPWTPDGSAGAFAGEIDGASAVVNLAGEPIAAKRWSADQKRRILESRVNATRSLVEAIRRAANPPGVFVSGSAVGYYGPLGDQVAPEETPAGSDFLASVSVQWESEACRAASDRTRVVCLRTGLVLEQDGGALPKMLPPFKLFAGGPVGSGRQYWPWIHRDDWIRLVQWAISAGAVSGPVNGTAPNPVTNREFAGALGRALHRPAIMPAPAFALRLMLGEMADALLLSGQRAIPAKAQREGFTFRYATLEEALRAAFRESKPA